MECKKSGIYQIANLVTGKIYIGSSINLPRRKSEEFWYLSEGKHRNKSLQSDFDQYGIDNFSFEVLEKVENDRLIDVEQEYLDNSMSYEKEVGYNENRSSTNQSVSVSQIDSVTLDVVERFDSIEQAEIALVGNGLSDNIATHLRGSQKRAYGFLWVVQGDLIDVEMKDQSPKHVQKIDRVTGEVLDEFSSIAQAETSMGIKVNTSSIREVCSGRIKESGGYVWRYYTPENQEKHLFVGCDVGKKGAITIIDVRNNYMWSFPLPMIGKRYDLERLGLYLKNHAHLIKHLVVEDVHAPHLAGRTSCFEFGYGKAILEMASLSNGIATTLISPQKWQKEMWSGVTKQMKGKKHDTKATSLLAVKNLFPTYDLRDPNRKTERSKSPHDGIVDSILIAEYCRRKFQ